MKPEYIKPLEDKGRELFVEMYTVTMWVWKAAKGKGHFGPYSLRKGMPAAQLSHAKLNFLPRARICSLSWCPAWRDHGTMEI